jgi:outer membrane receptor protein involved in Fe transport
MSSLLSVWSLHAALAGPEGGDFVPTDELRDYVAVSTRVTQPAIVTPASVSVITREQIAQAGYRSVAEALATVPGFYVSYDLVHYNVAVRGATGGARGAGRLLKIMIDGVPVPYAQTETYLLGPELIPITAVERIEILRGPASSLYGAGAYAGAINVVTRQEPYEGRVAAALELRGQYAALGVDGPGADGMAQLTSRTTNLMLAAAGAAEDRSGLSYPRADAFSDQDLQDWLALRREDLGERAQELSVDHAVPVVAFLRGIQAVAAGRLSMFGIAQIAQRDAEFTDLSVLSHETTTALANLKLAAAYERPFGRGFSATGRFAAGAGFTLPQARLAVPGEPFYYTRASSSRTLSGSGELRYDLPRLGFVLFGLDAGYDREKLPEIDAVTPGGGREHLNDPVSATITHLAGYGQIVYPFTPGLALAGSGRLDRWQAEPDGMAQQGYQQLNGRVAAIFDHRDQVAVKLIGGTAFKAASPEQLYTETPIPEDIEGDPAIPPQELLGAELVVEGYPSTWVLLSGSVFGNRYRDIIGYQLVGGEQLATAYDADNYGAEISARALPRLGEGVSLDVQLTLSLQRTSPLAEGDPSLDPFALGEGKDFPDNEAVPSFWTYSRLGGSLQRLHSSLTVEHRHVGKRTPSQSNLLHCPIQNMAQPCYSLPAYEMVDLTWSTTPLPLGEASVRLLARVSNVFDARYLEVGFNGVDVPGLGRTVWARLDLLL